MFHLHLQKENRKAKRQKKEKQKYSSRKDSSSQQSRSLFRKSKLFKRPQFLQTPLHSSGNKFFTVIVQLKGNISKNKIERINTWLGASIFLQQMWPIFCHYFPFLTALLACVWPSLLWHLLQTNGNNFTKEPINTWDLQLWTNHLRRNPFIFPSFNQILTNFLNLFIHKQS